MHNTSNIKIAIDMAIIDAGAIGHFLLPGTPFKNINPAEKPMCVNLPNGKQIKSTHTYKLVIPWLPEVAKRAYIVLGLAHMSLVSIKMLCDDGHNVEYAISKCRVVFKHIIVWKGTPETTKVFIYPSTRPQACIS